MSSIQQSRPSPLRWYHDLQGPVQRRLGGGDLVGVQGVGGLGHLGIQFAGHMGFHTVAIGRGREKEKVAKDLGAHLYIDTSVDDAAAVLQRMGAARAILATGISGSAMGSLVPGLAARGKLIVFGVPQDEIKLRAPISRSRMGCAGPR